jgi:hypothetical protein
VTVLQSYNDLFTIQVKYANLTAGNSTDLWKRFQYFWARWAKRLNEVSDPTPLGWGLSKQAPMLTSPPREREPFTRSVDVRTLGWHLSPRLSKSGAKQVDGVEKPVHRTQYRS